jgi:hypothetical protein
VRRDRTEAKAPFLAAAVAVLLVFAGCGSSTPRPDPARVAQLVAETNALRCSIAHSAHTSPAQQREALHRLGVLANALGQASAYLPAGRSLNEARAKERALLRQLDKPGPRVSGPPGFITGSFQRLNRLQQQSQDDYKALGLRSCGPPRPPISG